MTELKTQLILQEGGDSKLSEYTRPEPSKDVTIAEIPNGEVSVKIVGTVVSQSGNSLIIGDSTGQFKVNNSRIELEKMSTGRFLIRVSKNEDGYSAYLISFQEMSKEQINNYMRIVELEKRIPS